MDNLHVSVWVTEGRYSNRYAVDFSIPACEESFEPVDEVDEKIRLAFLGRIGTPLEKLRIVRKRRQNLAAELAKRIADELLKAMEVNDKKNGYLVRDSK